MNEDIPAINSTDDPEDRTVAIISHLSMEIQLLITNAHTFRIKSAYTLWIGPYIILGAILYSIEIDTLNVELSDISYIAIIISVLSYLLLDVLGGFIERHSWRQIKCLRDEMIKLSVEKDEQEDLMENARNIKLEANYLPWTYLAVYFFVILSVISIIWLLSGLTS